MSDSAEVSPGNRPITLVRRADLHERSLQQIRGPDPLAVLGREPQMGDQGGQVVLDDGHRGGVRGPVVLDDACSSRRASPGERASSKSFHQRVL